MKKENLTIRVEDKELMQLLKSAVESKVARLRLGLKRTEERLKAFERKYKVNSKQFASRWASEDLERGDEEYVEWIGEYRIYQRLRADLEKLTKIRYAHK